MRAVVQRVSRAEVRVDGRATGTVGRGLCVLVGVAREDGEADARLLADKVAQLRIFEDPAGKMNLAAGEVGGMEMKHRLFLGDEMLLLSLRNFLPYSKRVVMVVSRRNQADVADLLRLCDVFVLPSVNEPFGRALVEPAATEAALEVVPASLAPESA